MMVMTDGEDDDSNNDDGDNESMNTNTNINKKQINKICNKNCDDGSY